MSERSLQSLGLAHTVSGTGPPVLFVHGLAGSRRYWDPVVHLLGERVRADTVDLLGFGSSPWPANATYDVDCHLTALEPLVEAGSVVVAHSTGAILAVALARRHPAAVAGVVVTGLPLYPDRATARRSLAALGPLARWTVEGDWRARWACQLMCRMGPAAALLAPRLLRDLPAAVAADGVRHSWPSYSRTLERVVLDHDTAADLAVLDVPVTLVHGNNDPVAPLDFVRDAIASLPDPARSRVTLRAVAVDHHVVHRSPAAIADAIVDAVG